MKTTKKTIKTTGIKVKSAIKAGGAGLLRNHNLPALR